MNKKTTMHLLEENIARAATLLESGKNVAFPTETVYGLGADITNASAISRIFEIKGRPTNHPLIVHFAEIDRLDYWANNVPESAWKLAAHFWPGPLTLILPKSSHVPLTVTGGQDTVGLRVPDHPIALALLKALGENKALAAPSANRFGRLSPTSAIHVQQELGDKISMILDGGICKIGLESTIISFCDSIPLLLRPGGISITAIEEVLNQKIELNKNLKHSLATPGTHASHYAPNTRLEVWSTEFIHQRALALSAEGLQVALIIRADSDQLIHIQNDNIYHILMSANPIEYGQQLYATLRMLDEKNFSRILAEAPPDDIPWLAISDRLQRASFKT